MCFWCGSILAGFAVLGVDKLGCGSSGCGATVFATVEDVICESWSDMVGILM